MYDQEFWGFVNSFAPWLSAFATIAAVITALYLARKENKIILKVTAGVRVVIGQGSPRRTYLQVEVTNLTRRAAIVTGVYWATQPRLFRRTEYAWLPPQNPLSHGMPVNLPDGERASWMMPLEELKANFGDMAYAHLPRWVRWVRLKFIRVGITTSTGLSFESRIEKGLQKELLKITEPETPSN